MIVSQSQSQATLPDVAVARISSRKIGDSVHYRSQLGRQAPLRWDGLTTERGHKSALAYWFAHGLRMTFEIKPKLTYPSITHPTIVRARASWAVSFAIILAFLALCCAPGAKAGTITGTIRTPTGGTINRGTLTFNLSQPMMQAGLGDVILCSNLA